APLSPQVHLNKAFVPEKEAPEINAVSSYDFFADFVPVRVYFEKKEGLNRPIYHLTTPEIGFYTKIFLDLIKEDIAEKVSFDLMDLTDEAESKKLKEKFHSIALNELKQYFGSINEKELNVLAGLLVHSMYGLGKIELLMGDSQLEEVAINSAKTPISVYHREHGWLKTNIVPLSEEETFNFSSQIARKIGREITNLSPILDAHLGSGDRVSATLAPVSSFGNTITIRRFSRRPWTVVDFISKSHTMNLEMASLLWLAIQYEMNVLIAGGTASGKTATLNALMAFVPQYHRIISIEDVREINLPDYMKWNWVPLTTRNANPEGLGEVTMLDLMQSSLRMRPDRIILGEIRRKKEAEVLFEAMHTGHSVYSTLHANSSQQVLRRLTDEPISIPKLEVEAIDLILVQFRDRKTNKRRTYELAELEAGVTEEQLNVNVVFKWDPRSDAWEAINPASKFIRQLNIYTGMTEEEIQSELEKRAVILDWMAKNNYNEIEQVGTVMKEFYEFPEKVFKAAKENKKLEELLKG
ncbi:MAG: type II/IV secretion system ATPase subunit, partial [Candidatus Diapherotrites archaeon]|nr:type II/IV secretion system ATPase subunit [Candidatus Diapherotrites archaeon]